MNDYELHQQIGKLTAAVAHVNDSVNILGSRMSELSDKIGNIDRKLDNTVQKDTFMRMGFDYTQTEEHRKDNEWLRSQRKKSDSWRPIVWNIVKAITTAAAIGFFTYIWQSTTIQLKGDLSHYEQSK